MNPLGQGWGDAWRRWRFCCPGGRGSCECVGSAAGARHAPGSREDAAGQEACRAEAGLLWAAGTLELAEVLPSLGLRLLRGP